MGFLTTAQIAIQSSSIPQPLVGSWVTAGLPVGGSNYPITLTLGTASSSGNDATNLFTTNTYATLINPSTGLAENVFISKVLNNTVTLGPQNQNANNAALINTFPNGAFGTGAFLTLKQEVNNVYIQPSDGNTGAFYIGTAYNMSATFRRIIKLQPVGAGGQSYDFSSTMNLGGNPFTTNQLWVLGTAADTYTPSFDVI